MVIGLRNFRVHCISAKAVNHKRIPWFFLSCLHRWQARPLLYLYFYSVWLNATESIHPAWIVFKTKIIICPRKGLRWSEKCTNFTYIISNIDNNFWLVADGWCWFVLREYYCWLVASSWFVLREKYCWLVADKPSEQGGNFTVCRAPAWTT
jgi:hypothetical protein